MYLSAITLDKLSVQSLPFPKGWIAWLATAHVYVHNLLRVAIGLNSNARAGIEPMLTGPRPHSMSTKQPRRTYRQEKQISQCERRLETWTLCTRGHLPDHWTTEASKVYESFKAVMNQYIWILYTITGLYIYI